MSSDPDAVFIPPVHSFRGWVLTRELADGDTLELQVPRVAHLRAREEVLTWHRIALISPEGQVIGRSQFDSWRERFLASAARRGVVGPAETTSADADAGGEPEDLGTYASLDEYFREVLAEFVASPAQWILELLDMQMVRRRFEGDRYRYDHERDTRRITRRRR